MLNSLITIQVLSPLVSCLLKGTGRTIPVLVGVGVGGYMFQTGQVSLRWPGWPWNSCAQSLHLSLPSSWDYRQAPPGPKPSQFCISRVLFTCHKVTQVPIPVRFASDEKLEGSLMLSHHNLAWQNRVVSMKKLNNARTWFNKANIKASKSPLPHLPQKPTAFAFLAVLYLYFWIRCS